MYWFGSSVPPPDRHPTNHRKDAREGESRKWRQGLGVEAAYTTTSRRAQGVDGRCGYRCGLTAFEMIFMDYLVVSYALVHVSYTCHCQAPIRTSYLLLALTATAIRLHGSTTMLISDRSPNGAWSTLLKSTLSHSGRQRTRSFRVLHCSGSGACLSLSVPIAPGSTATDSRIARVGPSSLKCRSSSCLCIRTPGGN
ncbi:hypothetical protein PM082_021661 [Marasmius tenuissimus]|nr:hypothetical protein PM082_021661 [Marasmius tenuissimus]